MAGDAPGRGELAGREQELAELRGRRAAALAGHGALALVTGPPGIGKTRLAEELAGQARQDGHRVLWGRGVEDQGAPPLWMWRRILGAVGGDDAWGQLTGDGAADGARSDDLTAARYRAAAAAADAITAAADQDGLLVVLEDLHWADQASLFLLRELAAELPGSRLLVLATSREATGRPGARRARRPGPAARAAHAAAGGAGRGRAGRNPAGRRSDRDPGAGPGRARPRPRQPAVRHHPGPAAGHGAGRPAG